MNLGGRFHDLVTVFDSTFLDLICLFVLQGDRFWIQRMDLFFGFSDFTSFGIQRDRFWLRKFFVPSHQNRQIFEPLLCFFYRFGMAKFFIPLTKTDKFLSPSHVSFTDLGWPNFLSSLTKTDKFLNLSHASFTDLGLKFQLINLLTLP